jgi:arsenite/tail-anchored protein-transporting ATPase
VTFLDQPPRQLFFTGKGGVGKTSIACASAIGLADGGKRVLLVSTDPASNLDEVLGATLGTRPTPVAEVPGLYAMNLDPEAAARVYRERLVGPYRGLLPAAAIASMEEQLSGACTVEIAAFDEFAKLLGSPDATAGFAHVLFDTAPTGHTLRLLSLPSAWDEFVRTNTSGASCIGPLAGLREQRALYEATIRALSDPAQTRLVLVARAERSALVEAERTSRELLALGIANQQLVLNAVFRASAAGDPIADALARRTREALAAVPPGLAALPRTELPLAAHALVGVDAVRRLLARDDGGGADAAPHAAAIRTLPTLSAILDDLERAGRGVIMTMGKGGVGKTTVACAIAVALAERGHRVHLTTTDPAAHLAATVEAAPPNLTVGRIDPAAETRRYVEDVLATAGGGLDAAGRALLEEDLRSPCTEEVAVFRAFARTVEEGERGFVVLDTAPTGHTILLLDAAEAYHREVLRKGSGSPDEVRRLLPRLRDPEFTRILLVTLPEATPVHEAARLQEDLRRAGIAPFAWVVNHSFAPCETRDPILLARRWIEARSIDEVAGAPGARVALVPWMVSPPVGVAALRLIGGFL